MAHVVGGGVILGLTGVGFYFGVLRPLSPEEARPYSADEIERYVQSGDKDGPSQWHDEPFSLEEEERLDALLRGDFDDIADEEELKDNLQ